MCCQPYSERNKKYTGMCREKKSEVHRNNPEYRYLAFMRNNMLFIQTLDIKSFAANVTSKSVASSVVRFVVLSSLFTFKYFATVIAWIPSALMGSHVLLKVWTTVESFSANATEVCVLPGVVLNMLEKASLGGECFVTLVAFQGFYLCQEVWTLYLSLRFLRLHLWLEKTGRTSNW